jgi:hypothetical protein
VEVVEPRPENVSKYEELLTVFALATDYQAKISDALRLVEN